MVKRRHKPISDSEIAQSPIAKLRWRWDHHKSPHRLRQAGTCA